MTDDTDRVNPPPNPPSKRRPCDVCGDPASFTDPGEWGGDVYLCMKHVSP